jgi:hypothetical protein
MEMGAREIGEKVPTSTAVYSGEPMIEMIIMSRQFGISRPCLKVVLTYPVLTVTRSDEERTKL